MDTLAYCARSFAAATRQAAGVDPLTCPPLAAATFETDLSRYDLLYFDLHGQPRADYWMGDDRIAALEAWQIRRSDLSRAVVFATNCYLGEANSPMLDALLSAGARAVIAGGGRNWSPASNAAYGASLLGLWVRRALAWGYAPAQALAIGKARVALAGALNPAAALDTLQFRLFTGDGK